MNIERFEILAEAFGGDISRWPVEERDAAAVLMATQTSQTRSILTEAGELDATLLAHAAPVASADLTDRILASAPQPARAPWLAVLWPVGLGAGLAAACAAGVVAGMYLSAPTPYVESDDLVTMAVGDDAFDVDLDEEVG